MKPTRHQHCLGTMFDAESCMAISVSIGVGLPGLVRLSAASSSARAGVQAILPYMHTMLPGSIYLCTTGPMVVQFDRKRRCWELLDELAARNKHTLGSYDLVLCGRRLYALTAGGALYCWDETSSVWDLVAKETLAQETECWVIPNQKTWRLNLASLQLADGTCIKDGHRDLADFSEEASVCGWSMACAFDFCSGYLTLLPSLQDARTRPRYCDFQASVVLAGCIYAIAHCEDDQTAQGLSTASLAWRFSAGVWEQLPHVPTTRTSFSAIAFAGKLYVVGGESSCSAEVLSTVERFDPTLGRWETLAPMPTSRSRTALAVCAGRLYALGGSGDCYSMDHEACWPNRVAEMYDPCSNSWSRLPKLPLELCDKELSQLRPFVLRA
eukprot:TRINITY_DN41738_c0_g1_i1.p1 TRINITY_DN41738_c0_g1~~TRINITY_DN41738_c0_g1_i1.p1  ORF type:complete len:383 (+),score=43.93 TRINITY_DN41738_c0_g1_i1:101-1249(+)